MSSDFVIYLIIKQPMCTSMLSRVFNNPNKNPYYENNSDNFLILLPGIRYVMRCKYNNKNAIKVT